MVSRQKRIIWILNHTTLMEWEVPLLIENGYEVFVPKILPAGPNGRTAKVTAEYDKYLTIEKTELEHLNTINFYEKPIEYQTADILNRNFANCISAYIFPGLYYLLNSYNGKIFMRAFGHAGTMDYEKATSTVPNDDLVLQNNLGLKKRMFQMVSKMINRLLNPAGIVHHNRIMDEMFRRRNDIFLAAAYQEILDNENAFLKKRGLFMPLAIPPSIAHLSDKWSGGDNRILFICPNIFQINYYKEIYESFKKHLGMFPHCIAGRQDISGAKKETDWSDNNILGYVSRVELNKLLCTCSCMFYHSQEPRHLHYHPLEAISAGMPLIFMSGGLLEKLGGANQPGLCRNYQEAKEKISSIINGNMSLIHEIKIQQKRILDCFRPEFCESVWKKEFFPISAKVS